MDDDAFFEMTAKTVNAVVNTKMPPSNSTKKKQKEAGQEQMPIAQILWKLARCVHLYVLKILQEGPSSLITAI
ncbi:hypothetical protein HMPREF1544_01071 [Mucor circinelloides 1006PhL]|uniref:Uncharacterized protein n=1 Tax=Mucor circinelloides f. circinelloides (strain 1006PhL) TaxID=1220926 RepID=S2K9A2_MUCC1|nr:hypothetical protein HMPREF1544_01071 [Mucor circinelloides 1006PhL]